MSTKGKDPFVVALKKIEGFAPACSRRAAELSEATEEGRLEVNTWRDVARDLQRIARKALREHADPER